MGAESSHFHSGWGRGGFIVKGIEVCLCRGSAVESRCRVFLGNFPGNTWRRRSKERYEMCIWALLVG